MKFLVMPLHFRVAFVVVMSFFWKVILPIVAKRSSDNNGDISKMFTEEICMTEVLLS